MSTSHMSRAAVGAVALLLAVFVAACDEDEPSPAPAPSGSATGSDSTPSEPMTAPTKPVEPTLPVEAEAATKAGAKAFVQYYWNVVNYATFTGDVSRLQAAAEPSCTGCKGAIDLIERVYDRGGRIVGEGYRVVDVDPTPLTNGFWSVETTTRVGDQVVRGAGDLNKRYPGGRGSLTMSLRFQGSSWAVTSLDAP